MKYFFGHSFLALLLLLPSSPIKQQAEWELKKDEDGIKVYTRDVENINLKEFKASAIIEVPKESLLKILLDIPNYTEWIEDVKDAAIINQGEDTRDFYYQLSLPWPMKDRDISMSMHILHQDNNSILLKLVSNNSIIEEKPGFIRMHDVAGEWIIEPIGLNSCQVSYQFLADPEGFLPAWVVNIFIIDGPFKTLKNLQEYSLLKK